TFPCSKRAMTRGLTEDSLALAGVLCNHWAAWRMAAVTADGDVAPDRLERASEMAAATVPCQERKSLEVKPGLATSPRLKLTTGSKIGCLVYRRIEIRGWKRAGPLGGVPGTQANQTASRSADRYTSEAPAVFTRHTRSMVKPS